MLCLSLVMTLYACGKAESNGDDERSALDPALAAIEVDAATLSDVDGVVTVTIAAESPNTQIVKASVDSLIQGASLAFVPGSFDINFDVSLEGGKNLATRVNLTKLIDEKANFLTTAAAVVVTWTYDEDAFIPFKVRVPAPEAPNPAPKASMLAVLSLKNQVGKPQHLLGLLPLAASAVQDGFVTFDSKAYGAFQVVYIDRVAKELVEVETSDKQQSIGKIAGVPPGEFAVLGPTVELANAEDLVTWEPSDLAVTYDVKFDQTNQACSTPYLTLSTKSLSVGMKSLHDGTNYVCLTAVNAAGRQDAKNGGFAFSLDRSPPAVPAKPSTNGPVIHTIEPVFTWGAVLDVGPAGLAYYQVEIGTTPGAADIFNGPVTETTKKVIGFHGKTYYARVSAVDKLGNASAFSAVSTGVEVDSE